MTDIFIALTLIFLLMRLLVAGYNFFTDTRLAVNSSGGPVGVSILIPARNEEANIGNLLDSICEQMESILEVIVLDDHSTDRTKDIVAMYAKKRAKIRVISGQILPDNWTGKNYACHQLGREAKGEYLLFLDADIIISPQSINSAVARMEAKKLSLLSLFCNQQTFTLGEKVTVPLMNYLLLTLLPLRLIEKHPDPIFSAACGQFMMFTAASYHRHEWHKQAKNRVTEDLAIMKMVKQQGEKGEGLLSGPLIHCRMYSGFSQAVAGFSKNFITPFNDSLFVFLTFLFLVIIGPIAVISTANVYLITMTGIMIVVTRYLTGAISGQSTWQVLLHPIQMLCLVYIGITAVYCHLTRSAEWKGRKLYPAHWAG